MDISQNIKKYRKMNNFTQKELAEYLNVVPTTISAWELGRNKPLMDKVTLMADLFKVSTSDIVGDTFTEDNINHIFNQLNTARQSTVIDFAKNQLQEQNSSKIKSIPVPVPSPSEIGTMAAHSDDPKRKYSEEELQAIKDFADDEIAKYKKKNGLK